MSHVINLTPWVRIGLLLISGYLSALGADAALVDYIRMDPQLLAAATALAWLVWYRAAKRFGWPT